MVHRDGHPVQVAALPPEWTADLGRQLQTRHPMEERVRRRDADTGRVRRVGSGADAGRGDACRPDDARAIAEPRAEAVRRVGGHDRRNGGGSLPQRRDGRRGHRFEVRALPEPDGGRDRQHRLCADRGGPSAGQPDPLQPALSGEARLLPRRAGDLRLRRTQPRRPRLGRHRRRPGDVLQPADRPVERTDDSGACRRAHHGQGRAFRHCGPEHRDGIQGIGSRGGDELLRGAPAARHPAPQQRRGDCHRQEARRGRRGHERGVGRRRKHSCVRQHHRARVLRPDGRGRIRIAGGELPGALRLRGRSIRSGRRTSHGRAAVCAGGGLHAARRLPPRPRDREIQSAPQEQPLHAEDHLRRARSTT